MYDPLVPHRPAIRELRWRAEQVLAAVSTSPTGQRSPLDALHREVFAGLGAALTGQLLCRRRVGSSIGRAIAANSQAAQRRQATHAVRSEAGSVVQQAHLVVNSVSSVVGPRESRTLRGLLSRAEAASRADTALRRILELVCRLEAWQPTQPALPPVTMATELLMTLESALRRCIGDHLSRLTPNWWNERIPVEVRSHAERRKAIRDRIWPWLDGGDHALVEYLDFPDYAKVILNTRNWEEAFCPLFLDGDSVKLKLRELEPIRNDLAHSRGITPANADRLRLYTRELVECMNR